MFKFNFTSKEANRTAIVTCTLFILICYYNICMQPDLEKFNLKEQLPKPQNEAVVNDRDIADAIKHQRKISADFKRSAFIIAASLNINLKNIYLFY